MTNERIEAVPDPKKPLIIDLAAPIDDTPFFFTGYDTGFGRQLFWGGQPPALGLAGYDLLRRRKDTGELEKLNDEPLPVAGMFLDLDDTSPPSFGPDRRAGLILPEPTDDDLSDPLRFRETVEFLTSLRSPPFVFGELGDGPGLNLVSFDDYCLVNVYLTGNRGGGEGTNKAERKWTLADKDKVKKRLQKALNDIEKRKLIEMLALGKDDKIDFKKLLAKVKVQPDDCGKLGKSGQTSPEVAQKDKLKRGSVVVINSCYALDYSDEFLLALVLHELVHAVRFLIGVPNQAFNGTALEMESAGIDRETEAFGEILTLIENGTLKITDEEKCSETHTALLELAEFYGKLQNNILGGIGKGQFPSPAEGQAIDATKAALAKLLQRYAALLKKLPAEKQKKKVRNLMGKEVTLAEFIEAELKNLK